MQKNIKKILLIVLIGVLLIPMIQKIIGFAETEDLDGYFVETKNPELSWDKWIDGTYQTNVNQFTEENIGLRNILVRLHNQISYSIFNEANAAGVVIGKNNILFEKGYIDAYFGRDFIGKDSINNKADKLQFINECLNNEGVKLLVVFAPGKASFFPESIPEKYKSDTLSITNHEYWLKACKDRGIPFIDLNSLFPLIKDTATYPLYPEYGIHWSFYGMALGMDSILNYSSKMLGKECRHLKWNKIEIPDTLRKPDYDIAKGMNLLWQLGYKKMPYPVFEFNNNDSLYHPKVISIADSYYWQVISAGINRRVFDMGGFWFYYKDAYTNDGYKKVKDIKVVEELEKQDIVLLMATEATLHKFAFGFIEDVYEKYKNKIDKEKTASNKEQEVNKIIRSILDSEQWKKSIEKKAKEKNVTFEEMLKLDAEYMYSQQNK
ncbi:MAG: hypothetical protein C0594_10915 [Marinilabiliales bacterium]|nr:MAG: hypothetical protein C0594_10915 [Marinilabiliales bacterium]